MTAPYLDCRELTDEEIDAMFPGASTLNSAPADDAAPDSAAIVYMALALLAMLVFAAGVAVGVHASAPMTGWQYGAVFVWGVFVGAGGLAVARNMLGAK